MGAYSCISIENKEMRDAVVAVLSGDCSKVRSLIEANGNAPFILARWSGARRGVSDEGDINSFQLSQAMYDALKYDEHFGKLHVQEMWELHQTLFPTMKRTPYEQFGFITWNYWEEPDDNLYIDDEEYDFLLNDGVPEKDIQLTNYGINHMEEEVVRLLKEGATPYFLVKAPGLTEAYQDKDGNLRYTYFDVAPMLEVTKVHSDDYWMEYIGDVLDKDIFQINVMFLESVVEGLFNVGACERILHLTDQYISEKAKKEGEELMMKYLGKIHSIIK